MAIICGCLRRISSATARASSHLRASSPLVERPMLMRSMMAAALSSPSAFTSALRKNSSDPTPTEVCASTLEWKSATTFSTSLRETFFTLAMAAPTRCTSLALMCLRICAASCSPRVRSRIAARSVPFRTGSLRSGILVHPVAHHTRDAFGILVHQRASLRELLLVLEHGGGGCLRTIERRCGLRRDGAWRTERSEERAHQRPDHRQREHDEHHRSGDQLEQREEQRLLPPGRHLQLARRSRSLLREGGVDDVDHIPARLIVADGVLDELRDVLELLSAHGHRAGLTVLVGDVRIIDQYGNRQALQLAARLTR